MSDSDTVRLRRPATWPRKLRLGLEAVVTVMTHAYPAWSRGVVSDHCSTFRGSASRNVRRPRASD